MTHKKKEEGEGICSLVGAEEMRETERISAEVIRENGYLPGFRFHPTDEELVGFYLRRKVERIPLCLEIIKDVDIYKYDPWDLTQSDGLEIKEWYFFCMRGRKYRNSVKPNRVTGSGFWKATGTDKPIYKPGGCSDCIGLKKSLVYYLGSAGKGQKTEWMMHEFRLPSNYAGGDAQEAEQWAWTICRIFKRKVSRKRYSLLQRWDSPAPTAYSSSMTSSEESGGLRDAAPVQKFMEENDWSQLSSPVHDSPLIIHDHGSDLFFEDGFAWDEMGKMTELVADPSPLISERIYADPPL